MNKPEVIHLPERNAIDLFAPERAGSLEGESPAEPMKDFASEIVISSMRSPVPFTSRSHRTTALASIGLIALVAASLIAWRLNDPVSSPTPTIESPPVITESPAVITDSPASIAESSHPPVLPPVAADSPPPAAEALAQPAPVIPPKDPPRARETRAPVTTPPPAVRLERPMSQDPGRLVPVPSSSPSRASVEAVGAPPAPPPTASPPVTAPAPAPASAPPSATTVPPAVVPPPAAAPPTSAALPPAPTPAPAAASAAAAPSAIESNTIAIRNTLSRYQRAFSALDAGEARAVWPTVNEKALNRAFERLEQQEVFFDGCQIDVNDARAEAICHGTAQYVPRVGSRTPRVDRREWRFSLVKARDEWLIGAVEAK